MNSDLFCGMCIGKFFIFFVEEMLVNGSCFFYIFFWWGEGWRGWEGVGVGFGCYGRG